MNARLAHKVIDLSWGGEPDDEWLPNGLEMSRPASLRLVSHEMANPRLAGSAPSSCSAGERRSLCQWIIGSKHALVDCAPFLHSRKVFAEKAEEGVGGGIADPWVGLPDRLLCVVWDVVLIQLSGGLRGSNEEIAISRDLPV